MNHAGKEVFIRFFVALTAVLILIGVVGVGLIFLGPDSPIEKEIEKDGEILIEAIVKEEMSELISSS